MKSLQETTMTSSSQTIGRTGVPAENDPRWKALTSRDRAADGSFYYSVRTTGVYCRPSCGARRPLPENVAFHDTRADAERAGFRPCRRCKPDQPPLGKQQALLVAAACRLIETAEAMPTLAELAAQAGLSLHHFHRTFKAITGLTPRGYGAAYRSRRVRDELARATTVTKRSTRPASTRADASTPAPARSSA
jgi:AraC family transcriptional regulator of adaptative response/methylated-DNA-[protein]-cysteine methyltransferase